MRSCVMRREPLAPRGAVGGEEGVCVGDDGHGAPTLPGRGAAAISRARRRVGAHEGSAAERGEVGPQPLLGVQAAARRVAPADGGERREVLVGELAHHLGRRPDEQAAAAGTSGARGTSAFAPTMLCSPISAPSSSVACMPMRLPSPITAPCDDGAVADRRSRGRSRPATPGSVWTTTPSWMLVSAATEIRSMSPRSTAPGHTVTPVLEHDVADDRGVGVHEDAGAELGYLVAERTDGHAREHTGARRRRTT